MKLLVCGTRRKGYSKLVEEELNKLEDNPLIIIEGCCPNSADSYAEEYSKWRGLEIIHFPATSGNYLKRNIEMIKECDAILAFWDGYSYGTAHAIAQAFLHNKSVKIIKI